MATSLASSTVAVERHGRRRQVEAAFAALGPLAERRTPPPEGRLGAGEDHGRQLRRVLSELGPVFSAFGRYLSGRVDLLPRRTRAELAAIPDEGDSLPWSSVASLFRLQLGAPPERLYFEFHKAPVAVTAWVQSHLAWLSPGVPVKVTIVRPDAIAALDLDVPLLSLAALSLHIPGDLLASAIDDFATTLRRRLDQRHQASSLATLAADARSGGGFDAPVCYRDHCAAGILTIERLAGETLAASSEDGETLARHVTAAWLRQAFSGSVVPFDFGPSDIVLAGDRLVLTGAAFEPHASIEHARFAAYLSAVAADDPDSSANWMLEGAMPSIDAETRLRRLLRQAVPFREGEWSGDDRLIELALVQWRVARDAGWILAPHRLHLYKGLEAVAQIANELAPGTDALLAALENERLRVGLAHAGELIDPRNMTAMLDRAFQQMIDLPQKLDDVLTTAAEGRLRMKLQVPEAAANERVRNRTVLLVTALVGFAALTSVLRHVGPALGGGLERVGAVILLIVGAWLLFAAARL